MPISTSKVNFLFRVLFFLALIFPLLPSVAIAQLPSMAFQRLTISDGLSQNTVYAIYQDSKGFLWIGTGDGLNRYDGYRFRTFGSTGDAKTPFPSSVVNAIAEDNKGNLIIGTADGLCLFDPSLETVTEIKADKGSKGTPGNHITSVRIDDQGRVWVGTLGGLKRYDPQKKKLAAIVVSEVGKPDQKVYAIEQDTLGNLWAGWGSYILRYHPGTDRWAILKTVALRNTVRALGSDDNGLWIATEYAGLFRYHQGTLSESGTASVRNLLEKQLVRGLFLDRDRIWLACRDGLFLADRKLTTIQKYVYNVNDPLSISQNSLLCVRRDRAGSVWIGTYSGGLSVVHPGADNFSCIREKRGGQLGLSHKIAGNLVEDQKGNWWIATAGGGLNKYDVAKHVINRVPYRDGMVTIDKSLVRTLVCDDQGDIFIGTLDGIAICRVGNNFLEPIKLDLPGRPGPDQHVNALGWRQGILWVGTNGSGLISLGVDGKQRRWVHRASDPFSLPSDLVSVLHIDRKQGLWLGTNHGLAYKRAASDRFVRPLEGLVPASLSASAIISLFQDSRGVLWIGTQGKGLIALAAGGKSYQLLDGNNGLVSTIIHGVKEDGRGELWISTNKGVSRLHFKDRALGLTEGNFEMTHFTEADGIASNGSLGQGMVARNGDLLFGSLDGITRFHPGRMSSNRMAGKVVFTDFLQNSRSVDISREEAPIRQAIHSLKKMVLSHDQAYFTIVFSSLNLINPQKNSYAVRMKGLKSDNDWHYIQQRNEVTYTNLDPGNYLFEVKAANNDGLWNEVSTTMEITVLPPWWKTWWAYVLYTLVILLLLYLFYYFSLSNSNLKHSLAIERISHEKDNELTERKLDFFTYISHEIKTPLTLILAPLEKILQSKNGNNRIMSQLMVMKRNGDRLQRLIEQIMDYRKLDAGVTPMQVISVDLVAFCREVLLSFEQFAQERKIKITFEAPNHPIMVWIDTEKIEKVLFNLLSNALKFVSPDDTIGLRITEAEKISLQIFDTGIGIAPEHLPLLFQKYNTFHDRSVNPDGSGIGLAYSRELIELHQGTISVESRMALGEVRGFTQFTLELPKGRGHFDPEMVREQPEVSFAEALPFEKKIQEGDSSPKPVLLLVEDNPEVLDFLGNHFSSNYILYMANDGLKGWEKVVQHLPDIIVSDVMMPGINGVELCRKIKTDERTSHIPVILLTARTPLFFKLEGLETGADDYITKPFSLAFLDTRIRNLLESRRMLRERYQQQRLLEPTAAAFTSPDETFLLKVVQFVHDNLQETTLNVEEMAGSLAMSRMTLYRKITALTNKSPLEFIRSIRLRRAAKLLAMRQYTVNEVAYMVGFSSVDYFRRAFREETGKTPTEYVENLDV